MIGANSPLFPSRIVISSLSGLLFDVTFVLAAVICMFRNPRFIFLIAIFVPAQSFSSELGAGGKVQIVKKCVSF